MITIPKTLKENTGSVQQGTEVALGTLPLATGILLVSPVMVRGGSMISVRGSHVIRGLTAGDGPFMIGVVNGDLSLAELEEYLETEGPTHPDDTTKVEIASRGRKVRTLGLAMPTAEGKAAAFMMKDLPLKGLRFSEESAGWNWWLYNRGVAMTTGATWNVLSSVFVRWNSR